MSTPSITRLRLAILTHWDGPQYALAIRCAIDKGDMCRYMGGHRPMVPHHRAILAHVLGVEPDELDGWVDGKEVWEKVAN